MTERKPYTDDSGHTYLLTEKDAEAGGFKAVPEPKNKQVSKPANKAATAETK